MTEEEKKAIERIEDTFYQDLGKGINKFQKITLYEDDIADIRKLLNLVDKQQKEIEEKSTIIMAGAEKVKQLEKKIEELKQSNEEKIQAIEEWVNSERINDIKCISKDKIREKIEDLKEIADEDSPDAFIKIDAYQELLEEN
jgi:hypothetical protein